MTLVYLYSFATIEQDWSILYEAMLDLRMVFQNGAV